MPQLRYDLHCHTNYSDGHHSPEELIKIAKRKKIHVLSITDHDSVDSFEIAQKILSVYHQDLTPLANAHQIKLISGVEISVSWEDEIIHIVGLNIDTQNQTLKDLLWNNVQGREKRGQLIAESLFSGGVNHSSTEEILQGALSFCNNPQNLSRSHFARYLVQNKYAKNVNDVFQNYLAKNKIGYVPHQWANLHDSVSAIFDSGGIPIIAHPARYPMSKEKLHQLCLDFKSIKPENPTKGIEISSASHNNNSMRKMTEIALQYGFYGSLGSDFHHPKESSVFLGFAKPLTQAIQMGVKPVIDLL